MTQPDELAAIKHDPLSDTSGNTIWQFFMACHDGEIGTVKRLLASYPNLVKTEIHYHQPLHFALREDRIEVARHLLAHGADPYCGGFTYCNLREILDERKQTEALTLLGPVSTAGDPLTGLIKSRNMAAVQKAIDADPGLIHAEDASGNLPLHWAVMTRQLPIIDLLLQNGADIDARRHDGARPIDLTNGDYYYRGWRDVPTTALSPHHVLIGYLLARGSDYDISTAARLGDLERVKLLAERDPSSINRLPAYHGFYNSAALRNASRQGHYEVAKFLLENGADPNLPESVAPHGAALRDAIGNEHWQIVKLLISYGANPNSIVDSSGNCVWAAKDAPEEIRQLLAEHGGILGLDMACYDRNLSYIEATLKVDTGQLIHPYLPLEDKELIEVVFKYQPDVLTYCSLPGKTEVEHAQWLIEKGISVSRPNWLGVTPLHECARNHNLELAQLCLKYGASPDVRDDHYRETPEQWSLRFAKD